MLTSAYFEARRLWAEGKTLREIAGMVGCNMGSLQHAVATNRHDFPYRSLRQGSLQREIVGTTAVDLYSAGSTAEEISSLLGISKSTVRRLLSERIDLRRRGRRRRPGGVVALAVRLRELGLTLSECGEMAHVSPEAVRLWVLRYGRGDHEVS